MEEYEVLITEGWGLFQYLLRSSQLHAQCFTGRLPWIVNSVYLIPDSVSIPQSALTFKRPWEKMNREKLSWRNSKDIRFFRYQIQCHLAKNQRFLTNQRLVPVPSSSRNLPLDTLLRWKMLLQTMFPEQPSGKGCIPCLPWNYMYHQGCPGGHQHSWIQTSLHCKTWPLNHLVWLTQDGF